jgi:hypothetical protein
MSVPEALVALLLGFLVAQLALTSLARLSELRARLALRGDVLVALRVSRHVLRREMRHGLGGVDWGVGGDSLWLRAFRGAAVVCANDTASATLLVSYAGDRAPDPTKDSLLLFDAAGSREVRALIGTSAAARPCSGPGAPAIWRLDRSAAADVVVGKLFERGSYHLVDAALRYRRGASGRQPLTPEAWDTASAWVVSGHRVGVELVPRGGVAGAAWAGFLAWSADP